MVIILIFTLNYVTIKGITFIQNKCYSSDLILMFAEPVQFILLLGKLLVINIVKFIAVKIKLSLVLQLDDL